MKFEEKDVSLHTPVDTTDPGFAIKGVKLRWISGQVEARRAGRMWVPLKASMLPAKVLSKMKEANGSWFSTGDTIRKKDLTLAFAPIEQVEARRRELRQQQNANESVFRPGADVGNTIRTDSESGVKTERVRGDASNQYE